MPNNQSGLPRHEQQIAGDDREVVVDACKPFRAAVIAELEIGEVHVDKAVQQVPRLLSGEEIRFPDYRRQAQLFGSADRRFA